MTTLRPPGVQCKFTQTGMLLCCLIVLHFSQAFTLMLSTQTSGIVFATAGLSPTSLTSLQ